MKRIALQYLQFRGAWEVGGEESEVPVIKAVRDALVKPMPILEQACALPSLGLWGWSIWGTEL
jgi:hypothetical protein